MLNIIVCVKAVPDPNEACNIRIDPETGTLLRCDVPMVINPLDKNAMEAALQLKRTHGADITVLSMGPPPAGQIVKECLALGADRGILLSDRAFGGADASATAYTLARGIEKIGACDLVLCGMASSDGATEWVGPQMAAFLDLPVVTMVREITDDAGDDWQVKADWEGGFRRVAVRLPALFTVTRALNHPRALSFSGIIKARQLADQLGVAVEAVLLGDRLEEPAREFIAAGADRVYLGESPAMALYQPEAYAGVIVDLARARQPQILLMGSTCMGRELAPMVAARLKTGLTAHCIDLVLDESGVLDQRIPAYGGLLSILCPDGRPQMATVAGGVFPTPEPDPAREGTLEPVVVPADSSMRVRTLEVVTETEEEIPLDAASTIVAGGAGAGDKAGWEQIRQLADTLGAALGCTRPAVDGGWAELETMISQSGRMVSPQLYIGAGLSGELQHMVGIKGAKIMVAINNDPKSPVFEQVDVGIVEDCKTFIPLLLEKINDFREQRVTCSPQQDR